MGTFSMQMVIRGRFYCVVNIKRVWHQTILTPILVTYAVSNQFCSCFLSFHGVHIIHSYCIKHILTIYLAQSRCSLRHPDIRKPGGSSRWIFDVMLGSVTNLWPNVQTFLPEKCTHFTEMYRKFRPKMHPSLWNVQKIWPKIVPICMPYAWQILFKDIPLFLKSTEC